MGRETTGTEPTGTGAEIVYYYSAHSAFAYLGHARLLEVAAAAGRRVLHKPLDLHRVLAAGGAPGFAERSPAHLRYFFRREIWRWAEYRGRPIAASRPSHHDRDYRPANRLLIACQAQGGDTDRLAEAFLGGHWAGDADLSDRATLARLCAEAGLAPEPLLAAAEDPAVEALHRANTEEAIALDLFGSPTYAVDGDLFYGQDRLELVARACRQPFGPSPA